MLGSDLIPHSLDKEINSARKNLIPCRRVGPSQMRGWPGMWAEAYLLIPASMHTSLREPHTRLHAHMPLVWLLIFWFFCIKTKERNDSNDSYRNEVRDASGSFAKLLFTKHKPPY